MKKTIAFILTFLIIGAPLAGSAAPTAEQKRAAASAKINKLKILERQEKNKLIKNQQKLEHTANTLENSRARYESLNSQLSRLEQQYTASLTQYNAINAQVQERLRKIFKKQRIGMFQLILTAGDLNALLDVIYFQKLIIHQDTDRMMQVKQQSQNLAKMKTDIESKKNYLAQSISDINSQKKSITKAIAQNQNMINKLKTDRAYYERTERELAQQSASIQTMISKNKGGVTVSSSGTFSQPIGGRISSPFGWRTHPIFNSRTFHSGIDIAGPNLGAIKASNSCVCSSEGSCV